MWPSLDQRPPPPHSSQLAMHLWKVVRLGDKSDVKRTCLSLILNEPTCTLLLSPIKPGSRLRGKFSKLSSDLVVGQQGQYV